LKIIKQPANSTDRSRKRHREMAHRSLDEPSLRALIIDQSDVSGMNWRKQAVRFKPSLSAARYCIRCATLFHKEASAEVGALRRNDQIGRQFDRN
jgi:hypothetical protein